MKAISAGTSIWLIVILLFSFNTADAGFFDWMNEFVYEIDAPEPLKEFNGKAIEKDYRLYKVRYEIAGTEIGAVIVKLYVNSQPINDDETRLDFNAKAKHVYAKNDSFNIEKKKAEINGYSILKEKTSKLEIHVPWSELFKNL